MTVAAEPFDVPAHMRAVLAVGESAPAVRADDGWATWADLRHAVGRLDEELTAAGIGEYAPVGVVVRNSFACYRAIVGLLATRRTVVCLSALAPDALLDSELGQLELAALAAGPEDVDRLPVAAAQCPLLDLSTLSLSGEPRAYQPTPGVAVYMLTSGTTGTPTRVALTFAALAVTVADTRRHIHGSNTLGAPAVRTRPALIHAPLFHVSGLYRLVDNLVAGRPVVLLAKFHPLPWAQAVHDYEVRADGLNPTALKMVVDDGIPADMLGSLRAIKCGTAPLPAGTRTAFEQAYGIPVLTSYGATEFSGEVAAWTMTDRAQHAQTKAGAVGRVHAGVDARVVEPATGEAVPGDGVLELRSPRVADGAWVRTNDLARLDEDRFLWILGRADDVIIRGGFKVDPAEVVEVLTSHDAVADAAVVGLADDRLGKVPVAAVVLKDGPAPDEDAIRAWCRARLAAYKVPVRIVAVPALPRNSSLKIARPELLAVLADRLAAQ